MHMWLTVLLITLTANIRGVTYNLGHLSKNKCGRKSFYSSENRILYNAFL